MKKIWNPKSKTILSMAIASSLFVSTSSFAYVVNEDYKYEPNGSATGAVTGALEGSEPWLQLIKINNAANPPKTAGSQLVMNFTQLSTYVFKDTDLDTDISNKNFSWYVFKNPVDILNKLKNGTTETPAPTIQDLIDSGDARKLSADAGGSEEISTLTIPTLAANEAVGFVITPETSNGYPVRKNKTLIVPSVSYSGSIDEDGNPGWVDESTVQGIITLDIADGSNSEQFVPPRDIRKLDNINDAIANIDEWKTVKFKATLAEPEQPDTQKSLAGINGKWTLNISADGGVTQNIVISENGTVTQPVLDQLALLGVTVKSGPTYDPVTESISLELASNKPIKGNVSVDFTSAEGDYISIANGNKETYAFYDQPSQDIRMSIFDRGIDGKQPRVEVTQADAIYPSHIYEVAVYDTTNKVVGDVDTDVTGYFANYIKWTYTHEDLAGQFVGLPRCDGTVMFPTQTNNENAEQAVIDLVTAPTPWVNLEQGLRLKPTIDLPAGFIDGSMKFQRISGTTMQVCDTNKVDPSNKNHTLYSWFQ